MAKTKETAFEEELATKTRELVYGETAKLDQRDKEILRILDKNARTPLSLMAKKVNLSRDAVRYRIKRMMAENVIAGFRLVLNPAKMGYPLLNFVCFSLQNLSDEEERKFRAYVKALGNTIYLGSVSGRWDYVAILAAKNPGHFEEVLRDIRKRFSSIIRDFETISVLQEYKYEEVAGLLD